jgi:HAD superfamily hydrolase (TIGR01509 family)
VIDRSAASRGRAESARALIFDCDGVLADTERDGHLPAFNAMFLEFGLPVRWTEEEYGRLLAVSGGRERLATLLTPEFIRHAGLPDDPDRLRAEIDRWHRRKTELFVDLVSSGRMPARPGVRRIATEADAAGWRLAVCSTSAEASVRAILEHAVEKGLAARVLVLAGEVVAHKKPAPDIYRLALERLGVPARDAIVIEDSRNGLLAATGAGLRCVITVSSYTRDEDFGDAVLVVSTLGDATAAPCEVVADRCGLSVGPEITLEHLQTCLDSEGGLSPEPGSAIRP